MKRLVAVFPAAVLFVGLAACTDQVEKAASPTAPTAAVSASVAASAAPVTSGSTVCLSYVTKRSAADARLKHAKDVQAGGASDAAEKLVKNAEGEIEKLNAIVADACN